MVRRGDQEGARRPHPPGQPPHPRAFRRELVGSLIVATIFTCFFVVMLKWWALALFVLAMAVFVEVTLSLRR